MIEDETMCSKPTAAYMKTAVHIPVILPLMSPDMTLSSLCLATCFRVSGLPYPAQNPTLF